MKVVSIQAERKSDGEVLDWYKQLPACVKDNIFFTEAPGTGAVGELHAEEGGTFCQRMTYPTYRTLPVGSSMMITIFSPFLFLIQVTKCFMATNWKNPTLLKTGW